MTSKKLLEDIGLKVQITLDDSLRVIQSLKNSDPPLARYYDEFLLDFWILRVR